MNAKPRNAVLRSRAIERPLLKIKRNENACQSLRKLHDQPTGKIFHYTTDDKRIAPPDRLKMKLDNGHALEPPDQERWTQVSGLKAVDILSMPSQVHLM